MSQLMKEQLLGFVPAVVTPFTPSGDIMEDAFVHIVNWLIGNGATAICVAGDNGESWTLDAAERARLTRLAVDAAAGRVPVMTGTTAPGVAQVLKYAHPARDAGAAGMLLMPQTYVLKATRAELVRRFEAVAKGIDMPIVLYNSPRRAVIDLGPPDLESILDVAPVVGIKESSRDFFHHSHLLASFRDRLSVMVGPCHYIFPGIALGARGFIATGPEFLGPEAGRIAGLARTAPGPEHARLHQTLTVIYQTLMGIGTWPAALKAGLNLIGQPAGVPRDPVLALQGPDLDRLRAVFDQLGLLPA